MTWHVNGDGLHIYKAGQLIGVIQPGSFWRLVYDLAAALR